MFEVFVGRLLDIWTSGDLKEEAECVCMYIYDVLDKGLGWKYKFGSCQHINGI